MPTHHRASLRRDVLQAAHGFVIASCKAIDFTKYDHATLDPHLRKRRHGSNSIADAGNRDADGTDEMDF